MENIIEIFIKHLYEEFKKNYEIILKIWYKTVKYVT